MVKEYATNNTALKIVLLYVMKKQKLVSTSYRKRTKDELLTTTALLVVLLTTADGGDSFVAAINKERDDETLEHNCTMVTIDLLCKRYLCTRVLYLLYMINKYNHNSNKLVTDG